MTEPRQPDERETARVLGGLTIACLGATLIALVVAPLTVVAVPAIATVVFLLFFLWSMFRLPS